MKKSGDIRYEPPFPTFEELKQLDLNGILCAIPTKIIDFSTSGVTTAPVEGTIKIRLRCPRIICANGAELSIQASENHYCSPRENTGPYTSVEIGYPSVAPPSTWEPYAEEWDNPTDCVYGYVPIELVLFFVAANGGIDYERTFNEKVMKNIENW